MKRWLGAAAMIGLMAGVASESQAKDLLYLSINVPNSLNVDGPGGTFPPSYGGMLNVLEPMLGYKVKGVNAEGITELDFTQFEPRLVESWTFDAPSMTWTMKLRRGIKGCDGTTFNADDILYTFARAKSLSGAAAIAYFLANVGSVATFTPALFAARAEAQKAKDEGKPAPANDPRKLGDEVKKVDDYTVQIKQSSANGLFLSVMNIFAFHMYDKEGMEKMATADDPWSHAFANGVGVASWGPYCIDTWKKEDQFVLRANPDYYRGKANFDRVIVRKVPESATRLTTLRTGGAHITDSLSFREFDSLKTARGVKVGGAYNNSSTTLAPNWKTEPFSSNIKLRQAIAHAIPYQQLIDNVYQGNAKKWNGVLPSVYPGFKQQAGYDYNPAKAKQLLAEAGFPNGQGLDKFPNAFLMSYPSEREATLGPMATILRTALREVGIPAEIDPLPLSQYSERQNVKKDLQMPLNDTSRPLAVDGAYSIMLNFRQVAQGGINNWMNYDNARVNDLAKMALDEPDLAKRNALMAEAQDITFSEVGWVPVLEFKTMFAWKEGLKGISLQPEAQLRYYDLND